MSIAIVKLDVDDPNLPRQRLLPKRLHESSLPHYYQTQKEKYRAIYFEAYDNVINGIKERFHQPDFEIYKPKNTPRVFHVETTWKLQFPRRFNVEYMWCVCSKTHTKIFINKVNQECYEDSLSIRKEMHEKDLHWENLNSQ